MMTYLDLTNAFIAEPGINGGAPLIGIGASNNSQEALRCARFVADADFRIQALFNNWEFLWRQWTSSIATGNVLTLPVFLTDFYVFKLIDRDSLVLYPGTVNAYRPTYMEWRDFQKLYLTNVLQSSAFPEAWSIDPKRRVYLSAAAPSAVTYTLEGWAKPYRMKSDGHVSPIILYDASHPINKVLATSAASDAVQQSYSTASAVNEQDTDGRIIIVRALMIYAAAEGAQEIMQAAAAEYQDLLGELQSTALPGQESDRLSQTDTDDVIVTP